MSQVFLSYRQTNEEQKQRVRAFGERLRKCGIDVVLDQFEQWLHAKKDQDHPELIHALRH